MQEININRLRILAVGLLLIGYVVGQTTVKVSAAIVNGTMDTCALTFAPAWLSDIDATYTTNNVTKPWSNANSSGMLARFSGGGLGTGLYFIIANSNTAGIIKHWNSDVEITGQTSNLYTAVKLNEDGSLASSGHFYNRATTDTYLGAVSCVTGYDIKAKSGGADLIYESRFPYASGMTWTGHSFYDPPAPPACPANYTGVSPDCVPPPCPTGQSGTYPDCTAPPVSSGTTNGMSYDDARILAHEYALKGATLAISGAVAFIIIKQFRYRGTI